MRMRPSISRSRSRMSTVSVQQRETWSSAMRSDALGCSSEHDLKAVQLHVAVEHAGSSSSDTSRSWQFHLRRFWTRARFVPGHRGDRCACARRVRGRRDRPREAPAIILGGNPHHALAVWQQMAFEPARDVPAVLDGEVALRTEVSAQERISSCPASVHCTSTQSRQHLGASGHESRASGDAARVVAGGV
jgi:hypothetical protein